MVLKLSMGISESSPEKLYPDWLEDVFTAHHEHINATILVEQEALADRHFLDLCKHPGHSVSFLVKRAQYYAFRPFIVRNNICQNHLEYFRESLENFVDRLIAEHPSMKEIDIGQLVVEFLRPLEAFSMRSLKEALLITNYRVKACIRAYDPDYKLPEI